ncbi:hypothetical protein [Sphingomonas koreensis]|jgi:hypothetical protein|uniref:hypothetical protein n=1 Tax=Sphingomonas koreensis TaxID=93064 RepID=UPI000F735BA8|nr:hypothetical protein [Sphingomonas koreensis]MDC7812412.1 hypothetical protein [Sphingomonas koreensis]
MSDLAIWADRIGRFKTEALQQFAHIENSRSRTITLNESYENLANLSLKQDDLFRQSLRCIEVGVYRAAHVMCWSATIDFLYGICEQDKFQTLNGVRQSWAITSSADLRENYTDFSVLEAMRAAGLIKKSEEKGFKGMLSRRNECAHPSDYLPGLNETLGYVSEAFKRIHALQV